MKKKNNWNINRRTFLALAGSSSLGVLFKTQEKYIHKLIPYVNAPEYPKPGQWAHYLTTCRECPSGCGLMMWHRDGRITKAEGNPLHPINSGKICIRGQSSVLGEYDKDRLKNVSSKDSNGNWQNRTWDEAFNEIKSSLQEAGKVLLISDLQTGALAEAIKGFSSSYNNKPLFYEAFNYESLRLANVEMYGNDSVPKFNISNADLIISFGADFLETWLSPVEYARNYGQLRSVEQSKMTRCIYIGQSRTLTAANCDDFVSVDPPEELSLIRALIQRVNQLGRINTSVDLGTVNDPENFSPETERKLDEIVEAVSKAQKPVFLCGKPGDKSELGKNIAIGCNILNEALGPADVMDFSTYHAISNTALSEEVEDFFESVDNETVLIVHGSTNPAYTNKDTTQYFEKAKKVIFIGTQKNETALLADWLLPCHYPMEDWGDYEGWKGSVSLLQPVLKPIYDTRSSGDILFSLMQQPMGSSFREFVQDNWKSWGVSSDEVTEEIVTTNENLLQHWLSTGFISRKLEQYDPPKIISNQINFEREELNEEQFYIQLNPSHNLYDGKLANRGWLQEIPHPVTSLGWQSWVEINENVAQSRGIDEGDVLKIKSEHGEIEAPAFLSKHTAGKTLVLESGQGHKALGDISEGVGSNAFELVSFKRNNHSVYGEFEKTGDHFSMVYLNATNDQHKRELLKSEKFEKLKSGGTKKEKIHWPLPVGYQKDKDLYEPHDHKKHRWAMVIDLQKCIGCKACEAACYAENNIPVVGVENVEKGLEMSWLKVVPYELKNGSLAFQPIPCQHCDSAPCEPVCPVYASVHTDEGLNAQIYNRCIGTRYCSNNCPYKVRRFNWVNIEHNYPTTLQLNPEVTVRERGVMEKCTFCVQRIRNKQYSAKIENRPLEDGEVVPACMQTCPTDAIVFGDLMDENSDVRKLFEDTRRYQLLHELNTKTSVVYLKKLTL